MAYRVAVDIGGTFTDLVAVDTESGRFRVEKTSSNASEPIDAVLRVLGRADVAPSDIDGFLHGTTVTTNALLEGRGERVAFVTNRGFRDVIFVQHGNRRDLYDYSWRKPRPFVARRDCVEIGCRLDRDGQVVEPVSREDVDAAIAFLREERITAVAISFLFSYVNPDHERAVADSLTAAIPGLNVSVSHEIYPRWRENDRGITTVADAYLKPLFTEYVDNLRDGLTDAGVGAELLIMKSNGGVVNATAAAERSIDYLVSGPVGGVLGGTYFAGLAGMDRIMTIDIGGTSCDVALVVDGEAARSESFDLDVGIPICAPMLNVHTIGAGGGSIAWIDAGGLLRVGPQSAGSNPGPACYDLGGELPTLTDANLILGRLNPERFAGGEIELSRERAVEAVGTIAAELGGTIEEASLAIVQLANHNMVNALNVISVEQGVDPRETALVSFGGAGALHAAEIGEIVGVDRVLVPPHPGNVSAFGLLTAGLRVDVSTTLVLRSDDERAAATANRSLEPLEQQASQTLLRDGFTGTPTVAIRFECRYYGQNHYREIPLAGTLPVDDRSWRATIDRFHADHLATYGYEQRDHVVEVVGAIATASGEPPAVALTQDDPGGAEAGRSTRPMYFAGGHVDGLVVEREALVAGAVIEGPAIIEERLSTTLVPPGAVLTVHDSMSMLIDLGREGAR
jgi:N-methylhydantoinase A